MRSDWRLSLWTQAYSAHVSSRQIVQSTVLIAGLLLAACGGGGSDSSTADSTATTTGETTVPATVTTEAATTSPSTAPPTTLPATIDLSTLPGLLAVEAKSCAPEPYVYPEIIGNDIVCTLKPDGTEVTVVSQPGENPIGLALTRDGNHLWYGTPYSSKFGYVIDLTTGEHRERARYETYRSGISPDGQLLLFIDPLTYVLSIAHSDGSTFPDGSTSLPVGNDTHVSNWGGPSWAPDSVRFAYLSTNDGIGGDLDCAEVWIGATDGTPSVKITDFAGHADGPESCVASVRWSPTDDRILLHMVGKPIFTVDNLYVIDADGTHLTALTHGEPDLDSTAALPAFEGSSYAGDWSPDGKYIVLILGNGTDYQLAVMNADGSQVTPITAAPLGIATSLTLIRWSLG